MGTLLSQGTIQPPLGIAPPTIDIYCVNKTGSTLTVGKAGIFDLKLTFATTYAPGTNVSAWATIVIASSTAGYLNFASGAVYIARQDGSTGSLLDGEIGLFRFSGDVRVPIQNISTGTTATPVTAPVGSMIQFQSAVLNLVVAATIADMANNGKIVGFTKTAVNSTAAGTDVTTTDIYFNGEGLGAGSPS